MPLTTCDVSIASDARPNHLDETTMTVVADRAVFYDGSPVFATPVAFDPDGTDLPHVNQAGLTDGNDDPIDDFAFILSGELEFEDKTGEFSTIFQVFEGQSTFEVSLLREPDVAQGVAASAATATAAAATAVAAAANAVEIVTGDLDTANTVLIENAGSDMYGALSNTFAGIESYGVDVAHPIYAGSVAAAAAAATSAGKMLLITPGTWTVAADLTITAPTMIYGGASLQPASTKTVTFDAPVDAPPWQTVFAGAGIVKLGKPQSVCADWWGAKGTQSTGTDTIQRALDNTAQGTEIKVAGKYWTATKISIHADEDTGLGDQGKSLIGVGSLGVRTQNAATEWGAEIYLSNGADTDVVAFEGVLRGNGQPSRFAFGMDRIKVNGNKANQTSSGSDGISVSYVKDLYFGRVISENCKGLAFNGNISACNQIEADHLELMSSDAGGGNFGAVGDSHINFLLAGAITGNGVTVGGALQINQCHVYLASGAGVVFLGDRGQIAMLRANDNGSEGLRFATGAKDCYVGHVDARDNGTDTGVSTSQRAGVRWLGTAKNCHVGSINGENSSSTQQYAVRFDATLTGTGNRYGMVDTSGNVLAEISKSTSAAGNNGRLGVNRGSAALDFPSIAAGGVQSLTISVPGAAVGDTVALATPSVTNGLVPFARVSAADTVTVTVANVTASAIDPASQTYSVSVHRSI